MKTCMICQAQCADDVATCPHDGEASWAWSLALAWPVASTSTDESPQLSDQIRESRLADAVMTADGKAQSDPTLIKPAQVKHWQQPKKQR